MKWDVAFFLRNYPREYRFQDKHYRMLDVDERHVESIRRHTSDRPAVGSFFAKPGSAELMAIILRVEADNKDDAIELGRHIVQGFIDGLALLRDRNLPSVCPLVEIRRGDEPNSVLIELAESGWAYFGHKHAASDTIWRSRCDMVFRALFPFFDIISQLHPRRNTSLARQLMYSMKMYRHGAGTGVFGLEYICKWSALEGLVCGSERHNKRGLLKQRIPQLFSNCQAQVEATVVKLWDLRNEAVHEARAFDSDHLHEAPLLGPQIEDVEFLFLTVVTFALARIEDANSVQTLWHDATSFQLPDWARKRPQDMPRMAVTNVTFNTDFELIGGGGLFDHAFANTAPPTEST